MKTDVLSGSVRVYYMSGGSEVEVVPSSPLVNVSGSLWRYDWAPGGFPVKEYVAEYTLSDAFVTTRVAEDLVVRDLIDLAKQATLEMVQSDIDLIRKVETGRWKIEANHMTFYEDDGVTPLLEFVLKNEAGIPAMDDVFERDPV